MILRQLKDHTAEQHARTEQLVRVMDTPLTRDRYVDTLQVMYGFYQPLEQVLRRLDLPEGFRDRHWKTPDLIADLHGLGSPLPTPARREDLPDLRHREHALGALYVLEGANLGGQIITRHVRQQLGQDVNVAFFGGSGDQTGPVWKQFGALLTGAVSDRTQELGVLEGADRTFRAFERWLIQHSEVSAQDVACE